MPASPLPQEVLEEIIRHAAPSGGAFLVGGQALNFWAERYSATAPELAHYGPYTSKDVDFFGTVDVARKLALSLGGSVRVPNLDDHTPQSAIVKAIVLGREIEIDFLWNVAGPPADELKKQMVKVAYPVRADGAALTVPMSVMHPLHCLQSRAANVITLGRGDPVSKRQLDAAPIIVSQYISEALGDGTDMKRTRVATSVLRALHHYLVSDTTGTRVHRVCANNPLDTLQRFAVDPRLDERYRDHQLRAMTDEVAARQARDHNRAAILAAGRGFGR